MNLPEEFPQEYFVKLEGENYKIGRIVILFSKNLNSEIEYNSEVDIVGKESRKIWAHVDSLYGLPSKEEAIEAGVQRLADFLKSISVI